MNSSKDSKFVSLVPLSTISGLPSLEQTLIFNLCHAIWGLGLECWNISMWNFHSIGVITVSELQWQNQVYPKENYCLQDVAGIAEKRMVAEASKKGAKQVAGVLSRQRGHENLQTLWERTWEVGRGRKQRQQSWGLKDRALGGSDMLHTGHPSIIQIKNWTLESQTNFYLVVGHDWKCFWFRVYSWF